MSAHDMILYWASINYHPVYEQYLLEEYEAEHGPHFDEDHALAVVHEMKSVCSGECVHGELIPVEEVKKAVERYGIGESDTMWDAYVAINMWAHDMGKCYKNRHGSGYKEYLMCDAITWAFDDDDAPEGKVWKYVHAMR